MQVRQKMVPLREMSRLPDNTALQYFADATPLQSRGLFDDNGFTIPEGQMFVLIGGRTSLSDYYRIAGPATLLLQWSARSTSEPNMWVIRHKQFIGHNYTIIAFGAIIVPIELENRKNPVYDLKRELGGNTSREKIADYMKKVVSKL